MTTRVALRISTSRSNNPWTELIIFYLAGEKKKETRSKCHDCPTGVEPNAHSSRSSVRCSGLSPRSFVGTIIHSTKPPIDRLSPNDRVNRFVRHARVTSANMHEQFACNHGESRVARLNAVDERARKKIIERTLQRQRVVTHFHSRFTFHPAT